MFASTESINAPEPRLYDGDEYQLDGKKNGPREQKTFAFELDDDEESSSVNLSLPKDLTFREMPCIPPSKSIRRSIYLLLSDPTSSKMSIVIATLINVLITVSCITFILESLPQYKFPEVGDTEDDTLPAFQTFETIAIVAFTIEYVLRILTAHAMTYVELGVKQPLNIIAPTESSSASTTMKDSSFKSPARKTWTFVKQPFNIIDLLAILPFYLTQIFQLQSEFSGFSFIRILRLARVFRIFKLGKYTEGATLYVQVFKKSAKALYLLLFFSMITSIVFGSFIYFFEKGDYTENGCVRQVDANTKEQYSCFMRNDIVGNRRVESPYYSIPQSVWWVFTTITTVGYGDTYPTTFYGKFIAIITMHVGLLGLALPISIIGTNFREIFELHQARKHQSRVKTKLQRHRSEDLFEEMKYALNQISNQVRALQAAMSHYEDILKDKAKKNLAKRRARERERQKRALSESAYARSQTASFAPSKVAKQGMKILRAATGSLRYAPSKQKKKGFKSNNKLKRSHSLRSESDSAIMNKSRSRSETDITDNDASSINSENPNALLDAVVKKDHREEDANATADDDKHLR